MFALESFGAGSIIIDFAGITLGVAAICYIISWVRSL